MKKNIWALVGIFILSSLIILGCSKDKSYETDSLPISASATGSLKDSSGDCLPITVNGTYYNGIAIQGDTNTVQITVNAKTRGSYNIQTGIQNGFQFAGTGVFNSTGLQTITLKASGTPTNKIATNFNVGFDSTTCSFTVNVQDSTGHSQPNTGNNDTTSIALSKWQFVAKGQTYSGNVLSAQFVSAGNSFLLVGNMSSGGQTLSLGIQIQFPSSTINTGIYPTSTLGTNFSFQYASGANTGNSIYSAISLYQQVVNINVINYNSSSKVITGIFSGQAYDVNDSTVNITNGAFKSTVTFQ